ncbi:MAG: hypothetical protein WC551_05800 [Patescibacteria group bacterium]
MPYRMLIIDDDMLPAKGYGLIHKWFPGAFEIDEARVFIPCGRFRDPSACASALLARHTYGVILVDFNLEPDDLSGVEAVAAIRQGMSDRCPGINWDGASRDAHIIGVSDGWSDVGQRSLQRFLKKRKLNRGMDGSASLVGRIVHQLHEELAKFLASR